MGVSLYAESVTCPAKARGRKRRTKPLNELNSSFYVSQRRALPLATTSSRVSSQSTMATEVQLAPVLNGINGHGASKSKAKSKNQLRREKLKQKKVALASAPVRFVYFPSKDIDLTCVLQEKPDDEDVKMEDAEERKPVVNENVEYVSEQLEGAALEAFSDVFARFQAHALSSAVRIFLSYYMQY